MILDDAYEAQLEAELLSEKWDLPEPCFAPWKLLGPRDVRLRERCSGARPLIASEEEA